MILGYFNEKDRPLDTSRIKKIGLIWWSRGESICIFIPTGNENYGVAAIESGGKQQSTGLLHLVFQIPVYHKKAPPNRWCFFMVERT